MVDDDDFVCIPHRIGKNTLLCGKKNSYFPCQLFVGPEWYCSFVTYALIIVLTIFFLANAAVPLGPVVVALGTVSLFVTVMLFSATACSDPGIIFKYVTPPIHNTFEDDHADNDADDDNDGHDHDHDIEIATTSGVSMGNMTNIGGILEERQQAHGRSPGEEQQAMVAVDMNSDGNHMERNNTKAENKTNNDSGSSSSSHRQGKQPYVGVVPSSNAYTPYPAPTGNRRGDKASRKTNGNRSRNNGDDNSGRGGNGGNRGGRGGSGTRGNNNSRGDGLLAQSGVGPNGEIWTMECSICQVDTRTSYHITSHSCESVLPYLPYHLLLLYSIYHGAPTYA